MWVYNDKGEGFSDSILCIMARIKQDNGVCFVPSRMTLSLIQATADLILY